MGGKPAGGGKHVLVHGLGRSATGGTEGPLGDYELGERGVCMGQGRGRACRVKDDPNGRAGKRDGLTEKLRELRRISEVLAESEGLEAIVAASLDGVMELLAAEGAWLLLPEGDGSLELVGSRGISPRDARKPDAAFQSRGAAAAPVSTGIRSGFLCAGTREEGGFEAHHLDLLVTLASHTASAVRNARLSASVGQSTVQKSRTVGDPAKGGAGADE